VERSARRLAPSERDLARLVYSTNTLFEPTEAENPHGYTRFRAWALLSHGGDLSAAAKAAQAMRKRQEVAA
jgi:hypothetical protein